MKTVTTYFIDTENVHHRWETVFDAASRYDRFILLYTPATDKMSIELLDKILSSKNKFECILSATGPNALDFTLTVELGRRIQEDAAKAVSYERKYVILSDDHGYDPAVTYMKSLGYDVSRQPLNVTNNHIKKTPSENEQAETKQPTANTPGISYKPKQTCLAAYRTAFAVFPNITKTDAGICVPYLYQAILSNKGESSILADVHKKLQKYFKDTKLAATAYKRMKPAITHIIEHGPYPEALNPNRK